MIGWVLASNHPMLEMVSRLGFAIETNSGDPLEREVSLRLRPEADRPAYRQTSTGVFE